MLPLLLALMQPAHANEIIVPERTVERLANAPNRVQPTDRHAPCEDGRPCHAFILTPSVPVTFSKLQLNPDGTKQVRSDIAVGVGATFQLVRGIYDVSTSTSGRRRDAIEDTAHSFSFGVAGQVGTTEVPSGDVVYGITGSGFVGTGALALMGGYDITNGIPFIGLTLNVVGTSMIPGAALVIDAWR